jgi:hypothetical protein
MSMDATASTGESTSPASSVQDEPDLDAMFMAGSAGDHDAQAALALNAHQHGLDGLVPITDALACAELFARMAVTSGKAEHIMVLASILASRYDIVGNSGLDDGSLAPLTEYYLLMKIAADAGDRNAMTILKTMSDIASVAPIVEGLWSEIEASSSVQADQPGAAPEPAEVEAPTQAPADAG